MPGQQILRRLAYAVLGAVPATILALGLLLAWHNVSNPFQHGFYYVYLCLAPLLALLGTAALWVAACIRLPAQKPWASRLLIVGLISGLCAMMPWVLVFGIGSVLVTVNAAQRHTDLPVGLSRLLWFVAGPVLIAIDYFVLRSRRRASNNRWRGP